MRVAVFSSNGREINQTIESASAVYVYDCNNGEAKFVEKRPIRQAFSNSHKMKRERLRRVSNMIEDCILIMCSVADGFSKNYLQRNDFELIEYKGEISDMLYVEERKSVEA